MINYHQKLKAMTETTYQIKDEAQHASLFTTGNGYFGIRGSFEEFGPVNVQGTYLRGFIDEIIEIPQLFVDNIYMRKYYFDELKSKTFEYQDSCINLCDFLFVRFIIGGNVFYPWEGKILDWIRYIDTNDGALVREVTWDDGSGHISKLSYRRLASFSDNHQYLMKCSIEKINHDLPVTIQSGIDTFIKTNGQKKSKLEEKTLEKDFSQFRFSIGKKYGFEAVVSISNQFFNCENSQYRFQDGCFYQEVQGKANAKILSVEKLIHVGATMDYEAGFDLMKHGRQEQKKMMISGFDALYKEHLVKYKDVFDKIDIKIIGNDELDSLVRYANYQTMIAIDRYDTVHSLSAKNLTSEKYNQFVWWDAEIFQLPVYFATCPDAAKKALLYRYNRLKKSRENAKKDGYQGVKFAFCSSVEGDEKVWEYARHPFLQIHINSDIAYGILNYYKHTADSRFIKNYGLEMLLEISRYWLSRVTNRNGRYEILNVTGTDEHHPYVDNNAYTNFETAYILEETTRLFREFPEAIAKLNVSEEELEAINKVARNLYLPERNGLIPQFDGYFELSKTLEVEGTGVGKGFQMKESGLYHQSQIIKQPDVMMLFSYLNLPMKGDYALNWKYYEEVCEKSSSLSYPVHAICSIDNEEYDKFYEYWLESMRIDIDDLHHGAHQGLHAGCMAGGWYVVFRGLLGIKPGYRELEICPKRLKFSKQLELKFFYHGNLYQATLTESKLILESDSKVTLLVYGKKVLHDKKTVIEIL